MAIQILRFRNGYVCLYGTGWAARTSAGGVRWIACTTSPTSAAAAAAFKLICVLFCTGRAARTSAGGVRWIACTTSPTAAAAAAGS